MRKFLFFILFTIIGLSYLFEADKLISKNFTFINDIKISYLDKVISISNTIEKYFSQIKTIEKLREENSELKNYKALYLSSQEKLNSLNQYLNQDGDITTNVKRTRVLSYTGYEDFTKVWIDYEKQDDSILGLITDNYAAGIVVEENGKSMALLNGNKKCSYAVFIGENKVPGIVSSSINGNITVKFIPLWGEISLGDKVITSGMDNIFYEGLKVGEVIKIDKKPEMIVATLKPYANVLKKKYFFVYKENKKDQATNK